jgi:hypothetical protein
MYPGESHTCSMVGAFFNLGNKLKRIKQGAPPLCLYDNKENEKIELFLGKSYYYTTFLIINFVCEILIFPLFKNIWVIFISLKIFFKTKAKIAKN